MIKVRKLTESDLEFAKSLTDAEEWGNSVEDWERLYKISIPIGAYDSDKLVGVTTVFDYGTLGMIGNVLVSDNHRGKKIGSKLVTEAMKRLESCDSVRVHSTMESAPFYKKLGFIAEGMSTLFRLEADMKAFQPFAIDSDDNIVPAQGYLDEILEMDKRQFGGDRSEYIKNLLSYLPECAFVALDDDQKVKGFIVVKGENNWYEVGPWVVEPGCKNWRGMLQKSVSAIPPNSTVDIFVPAPNHRITSLLDSVGYNADSYYMSMYYGADWPEEGNICARGGGDKG
tara:strand:- start:782 stop:1633 length:852 start_codon:yes stop_codon:yes gene_type:complete